MTNEEERNKEFSEMVDKVLFNVSSPYNPEFIGMNHLYTKDLTIEVNHGNYPTSYNKQD